MFIMSADICCPKGSYGKLCTNYQDKGVVETVDGMDVYISGKGTSSKVIVFIYDIFGFKSGRSRQICDELAEQGYSVYMADFFRGSMLNKEDPNLTKEQIKAFVSKYTLDMINQDLYAKLLPFIKSQ